MFRKEISPELQRDFGIWVRRILRRRHIDLDTSALDERAVRPMLEETLEKYEKKILRKGRKEGKIEGKIEGMIEGKRVTARNMKRKGFDTATISEITGLSKEEIEKLR